ncbi:HNH endonuclease [Devosia beringensis]|uniref:HNH endonuclease n=1 Tax=Devosia beringensis TaxID=2657486 RepID=UPI00186BA0CC|nr:HNH endonuclease [Devosia beringensis]
MKAVFTTKIEPTFEDLPEVRYHFQATYLRQVEAAVGDWIIYYEPRRSTGELNSSGGRLCYFATARVTGIVAHPAIDGHFYALMSDYLPFDHPVSFRRGGDYYEAGLRKSDGTTNKGAFGRAVRNIADAEYDLILQSGYAHILGRAPRARLEPDVFEDPLPQLAGFEELSQTQFEPFSVERAIITQITQRPFRDRAFSAAVKSAYVDTCAITGMKIINGGGRSEVQAAHIRSVADSGPDSVRNGLALSGTVHWMFDRGLLAVDDDYSILVAQDRVPDTVRRLIRPEGTIILPTRTDERPHQQFLKYHRDYRFKG